MASITGLQRVALILGGGGFLLFGAWLLVDPAALYRVTDAGVMPDQIKTELRAFYGGLELGLGVFILAGLYAQQMLRPALWLIVAAFGGAALGRLVGMGIDQIPTPYHWIATAVEGALALLALSALRSRPRSP